MPDLDSLLRPRSVAVIGASARPESFGWHVLRQLRDFGYAGRVFAVNPGYREIEGVPCFASVRDIPEPVACAAICLADERLEATLSDVAAAAIPAAVIFGSAAGSGQAGVPLMARLTEIARASDLALMGASCMGFFNFADRLFLTGYPYHRQPTCGTTSFITHSGSTLSAVAKNTRGMAFNYVISPGQELVLTAADYLDFVLRQPETRVVGLMLETIRDPARFTAALKVADLRDVPVVLLKVGRTEQGANMAMAHTGAIAGAHDAIEAIAGRFRVSLVRTIEELLDTVELFASGRRSASPTLAAVTDSGGERSMMADLAHDAGVTFAGLSDTTLRVLTETLDPGLSPGNPADLWGSGRNWQQVFRTCIDAMIVDPAVGGFNFGIDFNIGSRLGPDYRAIAIDAFNSTHKPFAVITNVAAGINPDDAAELRAAGVPVLEGTETGLLAFKHLFAYCRRRTGEDGSTDVTDLPTLTPAMLRLLCGKRALTEDESASIVSHFGLTRVPSRRANTEVDALLAAEEVGYPVVLKTAAEGVTHKSDRGGVRLGIESRAALQTAYEALRTQFGPQVLVQAQVDTTRGTELFLGMIVDAQFGPLVHVGLGGIWIELLKDSVALLAPCTASEVLERLPTLRGFGRLHGGRGRDAVDLTALADVVRRFSLAATRLAPYVSEVDINPLLATGDRFVILDALIVPMTASGAATNTS